jgi:hypothetical protein
MKTLLSILAVSTILFACKKSDNGGNTTPAAEHYMNYKSGSTWNYLQTNNTTQVASNYTLTSTDKDSTINGRSYHLFNKTTGSNTTRAYYAVSGNEYFQYDTIPGGLATGFIERSYLRDNLSAGASWTQIINLNVSGFPVQVTALNTIVSKDGSRTVNGVNYSNVIHVKTNLSVPASLPITITSDINGYYAKKVGMIESSNLVNVQFGGMTQSTNNKTILLSSQLNN